MVNGHVDVEPMNVSCMAVPGEATVMDFPAMCSITTVKVAE